MAKECMLLVLLSLSVSADESHPNSTTTSAVHANSAGAKNESNISSAGTREQVNVGLTGHSTPSDKMGQVIPDLMNMESRGGSSSKRTGKVETTDGWSNFLYQTSEPVKGGLEIWATLKLSPTFKQSNTSKCVTPNFVLVMSRVPLGLNNATCEDFRGHSLVSPLVYSTLSVPFSCSRCTCSYKFVAPKTYTAVYAQFGAEVCVPKSGLNFSYNLDIWELQQKCKVRTEACSAYVSRGLTDNERSVDSSFLTSSLVQLLVRVHQILSCYKNAAEFLCFLKYPQCKADDATELVCREACEDASEICGPNIELHFHLHGINGLCSMYQNMSSSSKCWYKRVDCGKTPYVENAHVTTHVSGRMQYAVYTCFDGYVSCNGSATIRCLPDGKWTKLPLNFKCVTGPPLIPPYMYVVIGLLGILCVILMCMLSSMCWCAVRRRRHGYAHL